MQSIFVVLLFIVGILGGTSLCLLLVIWRRHTQNASEWTQFQSVIQHQIAEMRTNLNQQILEVARGLNDQLNTNNRFLTETQDGYQKTIGHVQHKLGELQEATHSMIDIGKNISSLQDILKAPKLRGGFSELMLTELLRQILPEEHYRIQYAFRTGNIVDAAIILGNEIIPIDAKFPLENFRKLTETQSDEDIKRSKKAFVQDVKRHIDSIANKYILPEEGTFDFALMYIPAENVYYELIIKDEFQDESIAVYAMKQRVIPVSPNSFYAYLQAIVRGLKGMRIEKSAKIILENLGQIETDVNKISLDLEKMGGHLSNAQSAYERSMRGFDKLQTKISSMESVGSKEIPTEEKS